MQWAIQEKERRERNRKRNLCVLVVGLLLASLLLGYGLYRFNKSYVIHLDPRDFETNEFSKGGVPWLVGFYIPGKHDDWVSDVLEVLGSEALTMPLPMSTVAVGTTPTHRDFARRFNVIHWPSIEVVLGETVYPFEGDANDLLGALEFVRSGWQEQKGQPRKDLRAELGVAQW